MSTMRPRRRFTPEFRAEAVALVEAAGGNVARVAKELGVAESTVGNWVRRLREQAEGAPTVEDLIDPVIGQSVGCSFGVLDYFRPRPRRNQRDRGMRDGDSALDVDSELSAAGGPESAASAPRDATCHHCPLS